MREVNTGVYSTETKCSINSACKLPQTGFSIIENKLRISSRTLEAVNMKNDTLENNNVIVWVSDNNNVVLKMVTFREMCQMTCCKQFHASKIKTLSNHYIWQNKKTSKDKNAMLALNFSLM